MLDYGTSWDLLLPHVEFAYNNSVNQSTGQSPFEVVTRLHHRVPVDLVSLPMPARTSEGADDFVHHLREVHAEVCKRIEQSNVNYKQQADVHRRHTEFKPGDLGLIHVRHERFPKGALTKLHSHRARPFKVLKQLGAYAHLLELPSDLKFSPFFMLLILLVMMTMIALGKMICLPPCFLRLLSRGRLLRISWMIK